MKTVRVNKKDLLEILCENRKNHKEQYKDSIKSFRVKSADLLNKELQKGLILAEKALEYNEIVMETANENYDDLKKDNIDLEIDISLIRMELNRRLYNDEF